jgi:hypothetical protein
VRNASLHEGKRTPFKSIRVDGLRNLPLDDVERRPGSVLPENLNVKVIWFDEDAYIHASGGSHRVGIELL